MKEVMLALPPAQQYCDVEGRAMFRGESTPWTWEYLRWERSQPPVPTSDDDDGDGDGDGTPC